MRNCHSNQLFYVLLSFNLVYLTIVYIMYMQFDFSQHLFIWYYIKLSSGNETCIYIYGLRIPVAYATSKDPIPSLWPILAIY